MDSKVARLFDISARAKSRRLAAGMTAAELATQVGVSPSAISKIETGSVMMLRVDLLWRVADALGVRVEWLMTGRGPCNEKVKS